MEKIKLKTIALDGYDEKYKDFEFECGYVVLYITINIIMLIWKNNSIHKIIKFLQTKKVLTNG